MVEKEVLTKVAKFCIQSERYSVVDLEEEDVQGFIITSLFNFFL